ncbi:uroporphyrinogen-III synthase [Halomonas sp. Bachu 37]|uniref:uroporphyrinogen-III synthase n=1 Tax=Halomonas kashgarensis TaxID=3084920 RepID=UPI0032179AD3
MTSPVLICRPGERGEVLAEAIRSQGWPVERLDVMQLVPLKESAALRDTWLNIDQFQKVVVVSPFAAQCLAEALDRYWPQLPLGIAYYAVGAATAAALHQLLGIRVHLPSSTREDTSEALLELASLHEVAGQRILLVTGEGGRPLLDDTLSSRGARITRAATYRRQLDAPASGMRERLARGDYRALIVTSGELLEHLANWCDQAALNQLLIVSSRRLATLAGTLGFRTPMVASGATPAALTAALARACNPKDADVDQGT